MSYDNEQDFDQSRKMDGKLWKRLFGYAFRNKALFFRILIAMIVVSVVDALYPVLTRFAIDHFVNPGEAPTTDGIWLFFAGYCVLIIVQGFFTYRFISKAGDLEMAISYAIRQEAYLKLQTLSFSYYDKTSVGYLMARMVSDVSRLSDMIAWSITDFMWSMFYIIFCFAAMFSFNWKLALIVAVMLPLLVLLGAALVLWPRKNL